MRLGWRSAASLALVLLVVASRGEAQGYRLRLDSRVQAAAYRGVRADSVLATDVVVAPTGGFQTVDGFFVRCQPAATHCFYFRPGPYRQGGPMVTAADLTMWGLGAPGLSLHVNGRAGVDLGESDWPGTDPALQLLEAYADYATGRFTARGGRQVITSRLGMVGIDGGRGILRSEELGLEAELYLGLGLARATALPVSSSALNPLDDFQPRRRELVAGGALGWSGGHGDVRLDYQREVDRASRQFAGERAALSGEVRLVPHWRLAAGAEYDLANTWFGNADATIRYLAPKVTASLGVRQYRPHFDLWTIWGAFSPVPYHALSAAVRLQPLPKVELRTSWERYAFSPAEAETPLVNVDRDGWRFAVGASFNPTSGWSVDAGYREEYGPGASSHGFEGSIGAALRSDLTLTAYGSTLDRPLEFRFEEAGVDAYGLDAEWRPTARLRLALGGAHYREDRRRPDSSGFDWNQTRLNARITLFLGSGADYMPLPRAHRAAPRVGS